MGVGPNGLRWTIVSGVEAVDADTRKTQVLSAVRGGEDVLDVVGGSETWKRKK